jgi:SSS family solute:Na+ symporter
VSTLTLVIVIYSVALIALGAWISRRVRQASDFFVAGRSLGAGLLFSTFLAANIGAGSTVGAAGHAYTDGFASWWWNGSAGVGSLILAFWVGPRIWREPKRLDLLTVGDFLDHHFGPAVRVLAAALIWLGSFAVLGAQIKGAAEVLEVSANVTLLMGAFIASIAATTYFTMGGLLSAAWVNAVQLAVVLVGFLIAAPLAAQATGGLGVVLSDDSSFWRGTNVGWPTLFLLAPAFFLSPGLIQKAFGARDVKTLQRGVAINGVALMVFACLPMLIGLVARTLHPGLSEPEMALPTVLASNVPPIIGSLALAAVFSAMISSADAVLFMLSTSGARDFYQGLIKPQATDREVLRMARLLAVVGGVIGFLLTFVFESVVSALTMFYSVMVVTLFTPILGGLFLPRAGRWGAVAAMLVGVTTLFVTHLATGGAGYGWAAPSFLGLVASTLTYLVLAVF